MLIFRPEWVNKRKAALCNLKEERFRVVGIALVIIGTLSICYYTFGKDLPFIWKLIGALVLLLAYAAVSRTNLWIVAAAVTIWLIMLFMVMR